MIGNKAREVVSCDKIRVSDVEILNDLEKITRNKIR